MENPSIEKRLQEMHPEQCEQKRIDNHFTYYEMINFALCMKIEQLEQTKKTLKNG